MSRSRVISATNKDTAAMAETHSNTVPTLKPLKLLQSSEYQKWFFSRYRERANMNYLWNAGQLYEKEQLELLFNTIIKNSPEAYRNDDSGKTASTGQDNNSGGGANVTAAGNEDDDEEEEIHLEAFYQVMKKQQKDHFMDRKTFDQVIQLIDRDGNRRLNKNEFYTMLMSKNINTFIMKLNRQSYLNSIHTQGSNSTANNSNNNTINQSTDKPQTLPNRSRRATSMGIDVRSKTNKAETEREQGGMPTNGKEVVAAAPMPSIGGGVVQGKKRIRTIVAASKDTFKDESTSKDQQQSQIKPSRRKESSMSSARISTENRPTHVANAQPETRFSQSDLSRVIGTLKYTTEREHLIKTFDKIRRDKSVDIEEKYSTINSLLNQYHFSVNNIGISATETLLSKQQIQVARSQARYNCNRNNSSSRNSISSGGSRRNSIQRLAPTINEETLNATLFNQNDFYDVQVEKVGAISGLLNPRKQTEDSKRYASISLASAVVPNVVIVKRKESSQQDYSEIVKQQPLYKFDSSFDEQLRPATVDSFADDRVSTAAAEVSSGEVDLRDCFRKTFRVTRRCTKVPTSQESVFNSYINHQKQLHSPLKHSSTVPINQNENEMMNSQKLKHAKTHLPQQQYNYRKGSITDRSSLESAKTTASSSTSILSLHGYSKRSSASTLNFLSKNGLSNTAI